MSSGDVSLAGQLPGELVGLPERLRVGSVLQSKFECVLEKMVAENPHMAGWFADDLGSRSWFPDLDWANLPDKAAYRAAALSPVADSPRGSTTSMG